MDTTTSLDDALPHALLAEQIVLGAMMGVDDHHNHETAPSFARLGAWLSEEDFHRHDHRLVFQAIRTLDEKGLSYDAACVDDWIQSQGLSRLLEHGDYLLKLVAIGQHYNDTHARLVKAKAVLRRLHEAGKQIARDALETGGRDWTEVAAKAEQRIMDIVKSGTNRRDSFVPINHTLKETFALLQNRYESGGDIIGLSTGFRGLDAITCGFQPGELVILASRPSMGKTSLALCIAEHVSTTSKKPVAIFSMGLSAVSLGMRLLSSFGRINSMHLRSGWIDDNEWTRVAKAIRGLERGAGIFIDDNPIQCAEDIRDKVRRLKREHALGLVIIDDLQLVRMSGSGEDSDDVRLEVIRSLKAMARESGVPLLLLSRLNRSLERRGDKRPRMSDMSGATDIEDEADIVVFLYREAHYNPSFPNPESTDVIVAKNREGSTGRIWLNFRGEYFRFDSEAEGALGEFE